MLPGGIRGEFHPVFIVLLEVLRIFLEEILTVEGASDCCIVWQSNDLALFIHRAARIEEVVEPDIRAVTIRILRKRVVLDELREVHAIVGKRCADRLVL